MILHSCYSIVTNVTRVENEMKISQIIVTNVTAQGLKMVGNRNLYGYIDVTRLLQHCYRIVTNVSRNENEIKISQIIVTNVTGCYECYSTSLENGQKSE
jgi:hypothetical protein